MPEEAPASGSSGSFAPAAQRRRLDPSEGATGKVPAGSNRRRDRGGIARLVLATAALSAAISGVGMSVAVFVTRPAPVAAAVKPSVVTITAAGVTGVSPFSVPATGAGSGFVVAANGLILTNYHVVAGASSLTVTLDDTRQVAASVVGTDAPHDLAVIKVSVAGLVPVTMGDSDTVRVGQLAIAIGSPLGTLTDSVTQGIVSGIDRTVTVGDRAAKTEKNLSGLIQTDAAVNPGNSGGPLLDANGSVVGVITASVGGAQGMGFAVPIKQAIGLISTATK